MSKAIAITYSSLSEYALKEIQEKLTLKEEPIILKDKIIFEAKEEEIAQLAYSLQSVNYIGLLLTRIKFTTIKELKKTIQKLNIGTKNKTNFCARCISNDSEEDSKELEAEIGAYIFENLEKTIKPKVNLNAPELKFLFSIQGNEFTLFLDFAGIDLSKRDYKVFSNHSDIKGTLAYLLLRFADYMPNQMILDPFSKSGTVLIEAALDLTNTSPNFFRKDKLIFNRFLKIDLKDKTKEIKNKTIFAYDSLPANINAARKNAKIADINKAIQFSRTPLEDIDLKFEKELDLICTFPTQQNSFNKKQIEKLYVELFKQAERTLKKEGKVALISLKADLLIKSAEDNNFQLIKQIETFAGKQKLYLLLFSRKT